MCAFTALLFASIADAVAVAVYIEPILRNAHSNKEQENVSSSILFG